jgi:lipoyl(octanoyl) transferase
MIDLRSRGKDLRAYVAQLEDWVLRVLADFDIKGEKREGRIGIWVATKDSEEKIAAVGVRVRKWVAYHGLALNVAPELSHFSGIVPCGIADFGVTSLRKLGRQATMTEVDAAFRRHAVF